MDVTVIATSRASADMDLESYKQAEGMTWHQVAMLIGATSPRQARAWALGSERPSSCRADHIETVTQGRVTVHAMHLRRLAWERANKRPVIIGKMRRGKRRAA